MHIYSDRNYRFACRPESFWEAADRTDAFQTWWPWLTSFRADGLAQGAVWECVVQPPLPYEVRFSLRLDRVEQPTTIVTDVSGDIVGRACLDIARAAPGCHVRLRSDLAPRNRVLRLAATLARPVAVFGHDWVLDTGARQFQQRALLASPADGSISSALRLRRRS